MHAMIDGHTMIERFREFQTSNFAFDYNAIKILMRFVNHPSIIAYSGNPKIRKFTKSSKYLENRGKIIGSLNLGLLTLDTNRLFFVAFGVPASEPRPE